MKYIAIENFVAYPNGNVKVACNKGLSIELDPLDAEFLLERNLVKPEKVEEPKKETKPAPKKKETKPAKKATKETKEI